MPDKTSIIGGSSFSFSTDLETPAWKVLNGIEDMPEFRTDKGQRETTTVNDDVRQYEDEMDTPAEQDLVAQYHKLDADQLTFRTAARAGTPLLIKIEYADGDSLQFPATPKNYGINGGAADATKMWVCTLRRTGDITHTEVAS